MNAWLPRIVLVPTGGLFEPLWRCRSNIYTGWGNSPKAAYQNWTYVQTLPSLAIRRIA